MYIGLFRGFNRYKEAYHNFFAILRNVRLNAYPFEAIRRKDGKRVLIHNKNELHADLMGFEYDSLNDLVTLPDRDNLKFYNGITNGEIYNIFYNQDYQFLPTKDRVVVDIGANIADSSIYFAYHGAEKVIALEPFPKNYEIAKKMWR